MQKKKNKRGLFSGKDTISSKTTNKNASLNSTLNDPLIDFLVVDGVLKKYNGNNINVVIPNNLGIESIGQRAFFKRTDIRSIVIPPGITSIANYAFSTCENLCSISIPQSVNFIGNYAFENCKALTEIELPDNLTGVGSYLFSNCTELTNIKLPIQLKTIGNYMFYKCESLQTVEIPERVTGIGWKAFSGCVSLNEIHFPNKLNTIGNYAFENCHKLRSIDFSANITNIGEGIFFMCKNLANINVDPSNATYKTVDGVLFNIDMDILYEYPSKCNTNSTYIVPEGVRTICYGAFSSCINLKEISLPSSLEIIDNCAFFNCLNLSNIVLHDNIHSIGKNAFHNCCTLTEIKVPTSINIIEPGTFSGCENLAHVYMHDDIRNIGEISFFGCISLIDFTFPANLKNIGCAAFTNCQRLNNVTIHENITSIAKGAFSHCNTLSNIDVSQYNTEYSSINGVLYSRDQTTLLVYPSGKTEKSFTIPSSVEHINDQAFYGAIYLEEVHIPSSVKDIGISSFSECPNLNKITISEGITSIGTFAFAKNPNLTIVALPKSVTSIDNSSFIECDKLNFVCSTDSFAYKFASIKNIPLYSEKENNFELNNAKTNKKDTNSKKQAFSLFNKKPKPEEKTTKDDFATGKKITEPNSNLEKEYDLSLDNTLNSDIKDNSSKNDLSEANVIDKADEASYTDSLTSSDKSNFKDDISTLDFEHIEDNQLDSNVNDVSDSNYMSDISDLFNDFIGNSFADNEQSNDTSNTSNTNNATNTDNINDAANNMSDWDSPTSTMYNPEFDNSVLFKNTESPRSNHEYTNNDSPEIANSDIGIQSEYSSPNKIQNVVLKQNSTSSVILSWDIYPETTEYHLLHFNTKTKMYDDVCKIKTNKALLTGIIPSHTQQYKIVAYSINQGKKELIASSSPVSVNTTLPPVEGLESIAATSSSLSFSWHEVPDAVKYIIFAYNFIKKTFVPVDECSENYITLSDLDGVSCLRIKVAAIKIIHGVECMTTLSDEVLAYTTLAPVTGIVMSRHTSTSIKLTWTGMPSVNAYKVYAYNPSSDKYEYVDTTPVNQIVFNNLIPNKEYKFKVRACIISEDNEILGPPSNIIRANTII